MEKEKEKEGFWKSAGERTVDCLWIHQPMLHNLLTRGTRTADHRLHCWMAVEEDSQAIKLVCTLKILRVNSNGIAPSYFIY